MEDNKILDNFNEETDDIENMNPKTAYTLSKPVVYNGKEYKTLNLDFEKLKGKDARAITAELQRLGIAVLVPSLSEEYLIRTIAKACEEPIGADFFDLLSIFDFNKLVGRARAFLQRSEL